MGSCTLIDRALMLAINAHAGQLDKGGKTYILHPLRVAMQFTGDEVMYAAADAEADARDEGDTRGEESLEDHNIQGLGAFRDVFDADGEQ